MSYGIARKKTENVLRHGTAKELKMFSDMAQRRNSKCSQTWHSERTENVPKSGPKETYMCGTVINIANQATTDDKSNYK